MRSIIHRLRVSPSLLVAIMAVVLACAGTASALPGKNTIDKNDLRKDVVKSKNIADGAIKNADLADDSVTTTNVVDETLTSEDVQNGKLTGQDVQDNSLTGDDVQESTLQGVMASQVRTVVQTTGAIPSGASAATTALCPATHKGISGGAAWVVTNTNAPVADYLTLSYSAPFPGTAGDDNQTGWRAGGRNFSGQTRQLRVFATCVPKAIG